MPRKKKTHEEYEKELFDIEIDYWPVEQYNGSVTKILHECLEGHQWKITPHNILNGVGCPTCNSIRQTKTNKQYVQELLVKNIKYTPIEPYVNARAKILHECIEKHQWKITPSDILNGYGCPICASYGFNPDAPATLYYIHISKSNLEYYKIGITNKSIKKRFGLDMQYIKVIQETLYDVGFDARAEEQRILKKYSKFRQNIPELLTSGGNTELFEFDILGLDTQ